MGRLIPAGTGLSLYRKLGIKTAVEELPISEIPEESGDESEKSLDSPALS